MERFIVEGGRSLEGTIKINGSKNATLPMLAASLMTDEKVILRNVPDLKDITTMCKILEFLGVDIKRNHNTLELKVKDETNCKAPYEFVRKMRASFCVFGPLLAKRKSAIVAIPGGCVIGERPVDLHIKGFRKLGATIEERGGYFIGKATNLKGTCINLLGPNGPTVTGTENVVMAAVLSEGRTIIEGASREPEVQELARFLVKMGAKIDGIGTEKLIIDGVKKLKGVEHEIMPDRIEAGTIMSAVAIAGGDVMFENVNNEHLAPVIEVFKEMGCYIEYSNHNLRIVSDTMLKCVNIVANPYPGFPTDLQPQISAPLSIAYGTSIITDNVFPKRFTHVAELNRMSANIKVSGNSAIIYGVKQLQAAPVVAPDIRAGAALVVAALAVKGRVVVGNAFHIDRGYERFEDKMQQLGAKIYRVKQ